MASSKTAEREARAARERLRRYKARQAVHAHKVRRRLKDNTIAIVISVVVVAMATFTQVLYFSGGPGTPAPAPEPTPSQTQEPAAEGTNTGDVPDVALAEARTWTGELVLNDVSLAVELDGAAAPQAVSAVIQDSQRDYFAGKNCHRLTNDGFFVLQCGSIDGNGSSDPAYQFGPIENAPADDVYPAGTIAMARTGGNPYSNGHQFFIAYKETTINSDAAGGYTVIGKVTSGLDELIAEITDKGVAPGGSAANDGPPVVATTISSFELN